jgi:hypothetical protein
VLGHTPRRRCQMGTWGWFLEVRLKSQRICRFCLLPAASCQLPTNWIRGIVRTAGAANRQEQQAARQPPTWLRSSS